MKMCVFKKVHLKKDGKLTISILLFTVLNYLLLPISYPKIIEIAPSEH